MDNERTIEKLLRRYAARRNEEAGAPVELRAFRRRQLQDEVIRRSRRSRHRHGSAWRQLLKFSVGALAMAGVYILVLRTSWNWTESTKEKLASAEAAQSAPPPLPRDSLGLMQGEQTEKMGFIIPNAPAADSIVASPEATLSLDGSARTEGLLGLSATDSAEPEAEEMESTDAIATLASFGRGTPSPSEGQPMERSREISAESNFAQFANNSMQLPAQAAERGGMGPVLNQFRMEQNGNELRVVDADGSVYAGSLQLAAAPPATTVPAAAPAPATRDELARRDAVKIRGIAPMDNNVLNYTFRVSGTNRTLNQSVVFVGNVVSETNAISAGGFQYFGNTWSGTNEQLFPSLRNAIVNGRAEIGRGMEVEVNATPVVP